MTDWDWSSQKLKWAHENMVLGGSMKHREDWKSGCAYAHLPILEKPMNTHKIVRILNIDEPKPRPDEGFGRGIKYGFLFEAILAAIIGLLVYGAFQWTK